MLLALAHVILNLTLCASAAKTPPGTMIPMHVVMAYRIGSPEIDKTFDVRHGTDALSTLELDVPQGVFRLIVDVPKYDCSTSDFLDLLPDHVRTVSETLDAGPVAPPQPVVLFDGDAPASFLYAKPTFVLFDASQKCDQPVGTPIAGHIAVEEDRLGFYVWMYPDPVSTAAGSTVVALRVRTPTGLYHYMRLPVKFPTPWQGWPENVHFDLTADTLADFATEKTDTLLCPKLFESSVH